MKKFALLMSFTMVASSGFADLVFTADNTDVRMAVVNGTTSEGTIGLQDGFALADVNNNTSSADVLLRWSGLTIDAVGTADDYIDFTISYTSSSGNINFNNQGLRPEIPWAIGNTLTATMTSMVSSTGDAVTFNGFTQAGFGASQNSATAAIVSGTINGEDITVNLVGTGAYEYKNASVDFAATDSIVWTPSAIDAGVSAWTRNMDYGFTVAAIPEPATFGLIGLGALGMLAVRRRCS